jgi:hypothetical protein
MTVVSKQERLGYRNVQLAVLVKRYEGKSKKRSDWLGMFIAHQGDW